MEDSTPGKTKSNKKLPVKTTEISKPLPIMILNAEYARTQGNFIQRSREFDTFMKKQSGNLKEFLWYLCEHTVEAQFPVPYIETTKTGLASKLNIINTNFFLSFEEDSG